MRNPPQRKRLRIGERKPMSRSVGRIEELKLRMRLDGTAPDLLARIRFLTAIAQKKSKNKRRLVEQALVHRGLKRSFRAIFDSSGFLNRKTKHSIREIVWWLYANGKISFKGETKVNFGRAKGRLAKLIGKRNATAFMRYFSEYLQDEKNYFESFMKGRRKLALEEKW